MFLNFLPGAEADADNSSTICAKLMPWLSSILQGLNGGMRRIDTELVVAICNYPSMGVISSARQHFCLSQVTALAHSFPRSFVAVIVLPNRAADLRTAAKCNPEYAGRMLGVTVTVYSIAYLF